MPKAARAGLDTAIRASRTSHNRWLSNPGLLLDFGLEQTAGTAGALQKHYTDIREAQPSPVYRQAFKRWRSLHKADPSAATSVFTV
ncbi:MAG: hypothetical protein ACRD1H_20395, partial [Vicinamibacterales bacterium]